MVRQSGRPKVALFLGAGFSKPWGLPLASEMMDMESVREGGFPGKWQRKLIHQIESLWEDTFDQHKGSVDNFGRMLQGTEKFSDFTSFLALRLSSKHWRVGTAQETKWGTGDHIQMKKQIPYEYREFLHAFKGVELIGIVTTNYDIVVEKLLGPGPSGRLGGFNYGIIGEQLLGHHAVSSQWTYPRKGEVVIKGVTPLLKLHGSLNWALTGDGDLVKYIDCRPSRGRKYTTLLLPPAEGEMNEKLKPIWDQAHYVLNNSDIWVICGYSIPDYDHKVHELLKGSAGSISKVCVSSISPEQTCDRLSAILKEAKQPIPIESCPGITPKANIEQLKSCIRSV